MIPKRTILRGVLSPMRSGQTYRGKLTRCCGAIAIACSCLVASKGADWPRFRGPNLDGVLTETNWFKPWPGEGPKVLWRASVGTGFASLAISRGRLYTLGNSNETDTVFCFDAATGALRWPHAYPAPLDAKSYEGGPSATPTVDGERVFTLSKRGRLLCLDTDSGRMIWEKNLAQELGLQINEWGFAGSPLADDHLLILNVGSAGTAVEKATGKVLWSNGSNTAGYASPVPFTLDGRRSVAIFAAKHLVAVEATTGRELWRYPWETGWDNNNADPIVSGNQIFISTYDRGCALLKIEANRPEAVYQNENMHTHMSACVKQGGYLYGMNGREGRGRPNDFRCIDFATGEVRWKTAGLGVGSLIAADGKLIILSETGELVIAEASPEGFKPLARAQVLGGRCWTPPALAQGRIYCRNAKGALVCLEITRR